MNLRVFLENFFPSWKTPKFSKPVWYPKVQFFPCSEVNPALHFAFCNRSRVKTVTIVQQTVRHVNYKDFTFKHALYFLNFKIWKIVQSFAMLSLSVWRQKDAPSSSENKSPPMGAPNAAATPAAAPAWMMIEILRNFCFLRIINVEKLFLSILN